MSVDTVPNHMWPNYLNHVINIVIKTFGSFNNVKRSQSLRMYFEADFSGEHAWTVSEIQTSLQSSPVLILRLSTIALKFSAQVIRFYLYSQS